MDMFDYAYQHGVNYFDTAWPYLNGTSEPFVGGGPFPVSAGQFLCGHQDACLAGGE